MNLLWKVKSRLHIYVCALALSSASAFAATLVDIEGGPGNTPNTIASVTLGSRAYVFYQKSVIVNGVSYASLRVAYNCVAGVYGSGGWCFETLDGAGGTGGRVVGNIGFGISALVFQNRLHVFYHSADMTQLRHAYSGKFGWTFETVTQPSPTPVTGFSPEKSPTAPIGYVHDNNLHVFYFGVGSTGALSSLRHSWSNTPGSWYHETLDGTGGPDGRIYNTQPIYALSANVFTNDQIQVTYGISELTQLHRQVWYNAASGLWNWWTIQNYNPWGAVYATAASGNRLETYYLHTASSTLGTATFMSYTNWVLNTPFATNPRMSPWYSIAALSYPNPWAPTADVTVVAYVDSSYRLMDKWKATGATELVVDTNIYQGGMAATFLSPNRFYFYVGPTGFLRVAIQNNAPPPPVAASTQNPLQ